MNEGNRGHIRFLLHILYQEHGGGKPLSENELALKILQIFSTRRRTLYRCLSSL